MSEQTPPVSAARDVADGPPATAVALLLPLSGKTAAAAQAIRDGFLSAYFAVDPLLRPRLIVRDSSTGAVSAYRDVVAGGASVVVGPLTKDEVAAVLPIAAPQALTLALNVAPEGTAAPARFYQFALAPEEEASQVAARLLAEGKRSGAALVPAGDWGKRVLDAFEATFVAGGGQLLVRRTYEATTTDFSAAIADVSGFDESRGRYRALIAAIGGPVEYVPRRRESVGFLFLAGQPQQGRLIRPQLKYHNAGELPVYSTSDIYEPGAAANQDLDGVLFVDMPWMLADDAATRGARADAQELWSEATRRRSRLYAFGVDAYRLIDELRTPETFHGYVPGATGRLTLDAGGRIRRQLDWAQFQADGTVRALPAPAANP